MLLTNSREFPETPGTPSLANNGTTSANHGYLAISTESGSYMPKHVRASGVARPGPTRACALP